MREAKCETKSSDTEVPVHPPPPKLVDVPSGDNVNSETLGSISCRELGTSQSVDFDNCDNSQVTTTPDSRILCDKMSAIKPAGNLRAGE